MTLEEKFKLFYDSAVEDATAQSTATIHEYQDKVSKEYERYEKDAKEKARVLLHSEKENMRRLKNKKLSSTTKNIKRQMTQELESFKEIIFSDVTKRLLEFMNTPQYEELLIKQIKAALHFSRGDAITIYINASDEEKKHRLETAAGCELNVSNIDFIGGTRAVIHTKNILIDNSFITKLAEEKESYTL